VAEVRIAAESRTEFGKGAARRVRRDNKVPAVLYGHGAEVRHISLPGHELMLALKVQNALLTIELDGASELALPKAVQRDPIKGFLEHVDLVVVRRGEKVTVEVNVLIEGEATPGTLVTQDTNTITIEADVQSIPENLTISIEGADIGTQFTADAIPLPDGVSLISDPETLVVNVVAAPTEEDLEAEGAGEATDEAAEGEAPEGEEAGGGGGEAGDEASAAESE
jgi:large subunit ribosomal protein L25